jgi:hypothetical protein
MLSTTTTICYVVIKREAMMLHYILVISLRSILLVEETAVPGENHRPVATH